MRCCLLLVCLLVRCFPVTGPSLVRLLVRLSLVHCWSVTGLLESWLLSCHCPVTGLLLVCRWSIVGLSLVCCWSVAGLLGSWPLVMVADRASLVHRSCVTRLPVPLSAGLLLVRRWPWPLLCLLLSRCSACLSVCWPVAFLSLVCLLVRRCWSVADVSLVCLLVHHWLSLSCTCSGSPVHRSSICSSVCSCVCHSSVCSCVCHSSVCSCVCHSSVTPLSHESVCSSICCPSLVRLLESW